MNVFFEAVDHLFIIHFLDTTGRGSIDETELTQVGRAQVGEPLTDRGTDRTRQSGQNGRLRRRNNDTYHEDTSIRRRDRP